MIAKYKTGRQITNACLNLLYLLFSLTEKDFSGNVIKVEIATRKMNNNFGARGGRGGGGGFGGRGQSLVLTYDELLIITY